VTINETSSYVGLAPLYGNNKEALGKISVHDGRGLLHPDTFAEDRLLLPPAVGTLLVLFNRNHNVRFWLSYDVSLVIHHLV
jgi:linoleate 10R-lipoxygenase